VRDLRGVRRSDTGMRRDADKPRADKPRTDKPRRFRGVLTIVLMLLSLVLVVQLYNARRNTPPVRYDEFRRRVRADQVEEVWIGTDSIRARIRATDGSTPGTRRTPASEIETSRVPDDRELVALLEQHHVRYSGVPERSGTWMFLLSVLAPIVLLVILWRSMINRAQSQQSGVLAFGKSRGKIVGENEIKVRFDDVAGVAEAKEELQEIVEFLRNPEKFTRLGAKIPKGVLLIGPPGTGKTLLARAVAGEASVPFFSISGSEFVEMFVGVGAARVRDMFEQATKAAPCIVFIDELDALGRSRGANILGTNEEREQTLNQLLVEMDGFAPNTGVIIMAATNRPEILDQALLRPGRFDRQVLVDRPDRRGREAILRVHARGVKLDDSVDLAEIAAKTPGFAGADLANVMNEAALLAARRGHETVMTEDVSEAIDRVVAGLEKKSRIIQPEERRRIAYHEAGHAIVTECTGDASRVGKISIVPRGIAALGYTMPLPTEDRYITTEPELRSRLAIMLGGRAAERVIFNDLSTGAADDLSRATELARAMVTEFGMSERLGPVAFGKNRRPMFLGADGGSDGREHGEQFADAVDQEIRRLVEQAETQALEILRARRPALERIATVLLEKEYLEGDELRGLLVEARAPSLPPPAPVPV